MRATPFLQIDLVTAEAPQSRLTHTRSPAAATGIDFKRLPSTVPADDATQTSAPSVPDSACFGSCRQNACHNPSRTSRYRQGHISNSMATSAQYNIGLPSPAFYAARLGGKPKTSTCRRKDLSRYGLLRKHLMSRKMHQSRRWASGGLLG